MPIDGVKVATLEDLQGHFTTEIVGHFRTGLLGRWLRSRGMGMARELAAVEALAASEDDVIVLKELCSIFDVEADDDAIAAAVAQATGIRGHRADGSGSEAARKPGVKFRDAPTLPELVMVPPGRFLMGDRAPTLGEIIKSTGEGEVMISPELLRQAKTAGQHEVAINYSMAVGVYPVTFDEWDICVSEGGCGGYSPSDQGWGRGNRPVINVSWYDARNYVAWLSWKTGKGYRLLNDSEWEYCARAGTSTNYWWGEDIGEELTNCFLAGYRQTTPVGSFSPNAFGLYDVHGNVNEWIEGYLDDDKSRDPSAIRWRASRGGSWKGRAEELRAGSRKQFYATSRGNTIGFRVARTLKA